VRTVATAAPQEALEVALAHGRRLAEAGMTQITVSMLQSVQTRRRLEVDAIQGFLCREGARLGVPTPLNDLCRRVLVGMDDAYR
jgi:ketopantoate reductase